MPEGSVNDNLLRLGRERFRTSTTAEYDNRKASLEDIQFAYNVGDGQWPQEIRQERRTDDRPCLTINKLKKFIKQIISDLRQNKTSIKVRPVDDASDVPRAEIFTDLIRNIEYNSNAEIARNTAAEYAVAGGFGYYRVLTEYTDDDKFEQDIVIKRIPNPFAVYLDQSAKEFEYEDGMYAFIVDYMTKKEYEEAYPKGHFVELDMQGSIGQDYEGWFEENKIRVAEYFYKKSVMKTIAQLNNGDVVELKEGDEEVLNQKEIKIVNKRQVKGHQVMWCKIDGYSILEGKEINGDTVPMEWPGKYIPIIPVLGDEINIQGKRIFMSLIRDAKDPQRMYNYWRTHATETVALVPKTPYIAEETQIEGHEKIWQDANKKNYSVLPYKYVPNVPPPQRTIQAQVPSGVVNEAEIANRDLDDTTGYYEASRGAPSNERSGKAILLRQKGSEKSGFTFIDNFRRAMIFEGKILVDLIPKIYDTERVVRLRDVEDVETFANINQVIVENGNTRILNDLSVGKYDAVVDTGPSYATKRMEAADGMIAVIQYAPGVAPYILPLVADLQDWPGKDKLTEILSKLFPLDGAEPIQPGGKPPV